MSFTGDLEHLSIVDVVQLLHATRKSGTLNVTGRKGTVQLVFSDGFIVSANHFDDRLKIGAILVEAGVLSREQLEKALAEQKAAGDRRRPLVATLIESGRVKKENAFHALESLIELTIVDILTWKTGSFTLDVGEVAVADEYRYFPEKLQQNVQFHTENVLMEALRIFDEKKRDGRIAEPEPEAVPEPAAGARRGGRKPKVELPTDLVAEVAAEMAAENADDEVPLTDEAELTLSADDLGLEDVDRLERKIPGVFAPIEDRPAVSLHVAAVRDTAPDLTEAEREQLAGFLEGLPKRPAGHATLPLAIVVLGADGLLSHCLATVCRQDGFSVFTTTDPGDVDFVAEQHRNKGGVPLLVFDREGAARYGIPGARHPHLGTVELAVAGADAPADGIRAVLHRPSRERRSASFVPDFMRFLETFPGALRGHAREQGAWTAAAARRCALRLRGATEAQGVVDAVLTSLAEIGARALAFVVRGEELAVSGQMHTPAADPAPVTAPRIPLAESPLLREAVGRGRCLVAAGADPGLRELLHAAIGAPAEPLVLLVPLAASGKTVSLLYADFGAGPAAPPPADLLELLAAQGGAALELLLCHKRLEKAAR